MKCKNGLDLCGFQLTNFCVQGEASAPSDAALGRKYFHTNATDDVATGISLLHRERIYLGEGAWRATAYLDDIAAINEKLNLITGDTDTDTLINNLKDLEEFLKDFSETDKLKSLLDGKLSTSGGTIIGAGDNIQHVITIDTTNNLLSDIRVRLQGEYVAAFGYSKDTSFGGYRRGAFLYNGVTPASLNVRDDGIAYFNDYPLIHSGNIGSQFVEGIGTIYADQSINFGAEGKIRLIKGVASTSTSLGFPNRYTSGISVLSDYCGWQMLTHGGASINNPYFRKLNDNGVWSDWKTIAFTDSDITGYSAGLKHSNGVIGAVTNSAGCVTIGGSDLASTNYRLYVDGSFKATTVHARALINYESGGYGCYIGDGYYSVGTAEHGACVYTYGARPIYFYTDGNEKMRIAANGNVLIGTTTDSGYKLDVNGDGRFSDAIYTDIIRNYSGVLVFGSDASGNITIGTRASSHVIDFMTSKGVVMSVADNGDTYIKGNLIVDGNIVGKKEVSAGGAGAEGGTSGSGSAEGVSEIFTPTSTSMAFDHNLGEDVIVQVYEKNNSVWNLVMVDVEITSATRVTLRFGKTETTQHKVVIMGV